MTKQKSLFNIICTICVICFIFLAAVPLITLAFPTIQLLPPPPPMPVEVTKEETAPPTNEDLTTKPEYDIFTVGERQERNLPTLSLASDPYYGTKVIYLTFDDGPALENTPLVLDILKENNIKATFFVVGTEILKYPDILKRIYDEGHAIGNHTYNHIYSEMYRSVTTYTEQLQHTDQIIKSIINVRPHISRAPGGSTGSFTKIYWDTLKNQGYTDIGWNISAGDASSAKSEKILANIFQQTEKNKFLWSHAILLLHDGRGHAETVKALPQIIKFYQEQGFEFRVINSKTPSAW